MENTANVTGIVVASMTRARIPLKFNMDRIKAKK